MWQLGEQSGEDKSESVKTIDQAVDRILYQQYTTQLPYCTFKTESRLKVEVQWKVVSCGISPNTFQSKVFSVLTSTDPNVRNTDRPLPTLKSGRSTNQRVYWSFNTLPLYYSLRLSSDFSEAISKRFQLTMYTSRESIWKISHFDKLIQQNRYKACSKSQSCYSVNLELTRIWRQNFLP